MNTVNWKIGSKYKFNTIAPSVLGNTFSNLKLLSIMGFEEAVKKQDVITIHNQIKNQVANANLPNRVQDCTFLYFENAGGDKLVFANEYLTNVETVTTTTLLITVKNYTGTDLTNITAALNKLGYYDLETSIETTSS